MISEAQASYNDKLISRTTSLSMKYSIINGLGKTYITFINAIVGVIIRIGFIILMVPKYGIKGYLIGLLISQLIISFLDIYNSCKYIKITFNVYDWLLKPSILITIEGFLIYKLYNFLSLNSQVNKLLLLLVAAVILTVTYVLSLLILKSITIDEIRRTK